MIASKQSLKALDWLNVFLADVRYGINAFFSVYLLTALHWNQEEIGYIMAIPGITAIIFQSPAGALIDYSKHKRILVIIACVIVATCSLGITLLTDRVHIYILAIVMGITITIYSPAISAITMGLVGSKLFPERMGRNQTLNHAGNVIITIITGLAGYYLGYTWVFYIMSIMCCFSIVIILFIKEQEIDHIAAREAETVNGQEKVIPLLKVLFSRKIILFTIAVILFYLSNGAMFPLLGQKIALLNKQTSTLYTAAGIIIAEIVMVPFAFFTGKASVKYNRKHIYLIAFAILPVRALLYTLSENPNVLIFIQVLDGAAAGISGVISIIMVADLTKGTGRFNFMQGLIATSIEAGEAISHFTSGIIVKNYGYSMGFYYLSCLGLIALLFFILSVKNTNPSLA